MARREISAMHLPSKGEQGVEGVRVCETDDAQECLPHEYDAHRSLSKRTRHRLTLAAAELRPTLFEISGAPNARPSESRCWASRLRADQRSQSLQDGRDALHRDLARKLRAS